MKFNKKYIIAGLVTLIGITGGLFTGAKIFSSNSTEVKTNTEIVAYDYTGLKHICDIQNPLSETTWYSYIWNVNVPEGLSKAGIKVNENEFSIYEEDYYEKGTSLNEVTIYTPISEEDNIRWYGWSENIPFEEGGIIINEADWYSIIGTNGIQSCKVFYGNWEKIPPKDQRWQHFIEEIKLD